MIGLRFGRLTIIREGSMGSRHHHYWICRCTCGRTKRVSHDHLRSGATRSCGCLRNEITGKRAKSLNRTHGKSRTREYRSWRSMRSRCSNRSDEHYPIYGGRGIFVSPKWDRSFAAFYADMGAALPQHTLDRLDNNGPYCASNCRWATHAQQAANRRTSKRYAWNKRRLTLREWANEFGLDRRLLRDRIERRGWSLHVAFTTPRRQYRHHVY